MLKGKIIICLIVTIFSSFPFLVDVYGQNSRMKKNSLIIKLQNIEHQPDTNASEEFYNAGKFARINETGYFCAYEKLWNICMFPGIGLCKRQGPSIGNQDR